MDKIKTEREKNFVVYKANLDNLLENHYGKYVAICKEEIYIGNTKEEVIVRSNKEHSDAKHRFVFKIEEKEKIEGNLRFRLPMRCAEK